MPTPALAPFVIGAFGNALGVGWLLSDDGSEFYFSPGERTTTFLVTPHELRILREEVGFP